MPCQIGQSGVTVKRGWRRPGQCPLGQDQRRRKLQVPGSRPQTLPRAGAWRAGAGRHELIGGWPALLGGVGRGCEVGPSAGDLPLPARVEWGQDMGTFPQGKGLE